MDSIPRPIPLRIIQNDYPATLAVMAPVITWGLYAALNFFGILRVGGAGGTSRETFFALSIAVTAIGAGALLVRIYTFYSVYGRGAETAGQITNVGFYRDRGRVAYRYDYRGHAYSGWNPISRTARTRALHPGDDVVIVVDSANPARSFIRDLYL